MQLVLNSSTDPAFNLALEEHALTAMDRDMILLWRNSGAVIIGRNQNAVEEIDLDYVRQQGITVIRRQSGGGAVFHDLGNINFTVIHGLGGDDFSNYHKFTAPICRYLSSLGVDARLEGRNDLTIAGMKFSGNAQAVKNGRIMHHGTILFDADVTRLTGALRPRAAKIESKGVKSVRSRVTNVAAHLPQSMTVEAFLAGLAEFYRQGGDTPLAEYTLTERDHAAVRRLVAEKYGTWEWNFGKSPPYNFQRSARFPFGIVDVRLTVTDGVMEAVGIFGDFFGQLELSGLEGRLTGLRHSRDAIAGALGDIDLETYIHGITREQFLELF